MVEEQKMPENMPAPNKVQPEMGVQASQEGEMASEDMLSDLMAQFEQAQNKFR